MNVQLAPGQVPAEVTPGSVIAGRYRVERTLGQGGMGVVLAARHVTLGQRVAIKLMLPEALADAEAVERFMREAWAASRINSEYVTRVFDLGELPSGTPYIVMEFLEGEDLAARLRRTGPLPVPEIASIGLQICEALAEAHAVGVVHRDLKPSNAFCVRRSGGLSSIKVLDFGISKLLTQDSLRGEHDLTSTRSLMGSPSYMSPEQMRTPRDVDMRSDIWSLGVMLYEMSSGALPFQAETLPELAVRMATEEPAALAGLRRDLPAGWISVISCCLQKPRERRYADVARLAQALAPFAPAAERIHAERAARVLQHASAGYGGWNAQTTQPLAAPGPAPSTTGVRQRAARRLWLPGALVLAVLVGAIVWLLRAPQPAVSEPNVLRPLPPTAATIATEVPAPPPQAAEVAEPAPVLEPAVDEAVTPAPASPPVAAGGAAANKPKPRAAAAAPRATPAKASEAPAKPAPARPAEVTPPPRPAVVGTDELGGRL